MINDSDLQIINNIVNNVVDSKLKTVQDSIITIKESLKIITDFVSNNARDNLTMLSDLQKGTSNTLSVTLANMLEFLGKKIQISQDEVNQLIKKCYIDVEELCKKEQEKEKN